MAVYQVCKGTKDLCILQLYLLILQILSLELCTQVKLAAIKYHESSAQERVDAFILFCPHNKIVQSTLAAVFL